MLTNRINDTNAFFLAKVRKQVNSAFTIRNWIIGYYIVEYEQNGEDRAMYGNQLLERLARELKAKGLIGLSTTNLKLFRQFYLFYPQIRQTLSDEFQFNDYQKIIPDFETLPLTFDANEYVEKALLEKLSELSAGDNPPIGIILCAGKSASLVKYATAGMEHKLFVSQYMTNLPDEAQLARILEAEQERVAG